MRVRTLAFLVFVMGLCGMMLFAAEGVECTLTLDDSVDTALHNSQDLLALHERIQSAQQRVNEARSQNFPKIDLNLNASRFENELPTVLAPSFGSIYLPVEKKDLYYSTRVSLWQYLYASGRYTTNLRLAEINLSQVQSQSDATRQRLVLEVRKTFYACLALQAKIAAYRQAVAEVHADKGPSSRETALTMQMEKVQHEYELARLRYLDVVGLELNTLFALSGELRPPVETYDIEKCIAWAFELRPELRQTQFQETIDSLRVNLSLAERFPTVTLGANYEWFGDRLPFDQKNWNATVNVNLPLFDGWASWARIKQQRNQAREAKIRRSGIQDQVRLEVRQALMDYQFWQKQAIEFDRRLPEEPSGERRLERTLMKLDTLQQALSSQAALEWATGYPKR